MLFGLILASVIINEIAWMGTDVSYNNEWIELYNTTNNSINLDGWILKADDGVPEINLKGTIIANGLYLLERTDDNSNPYKTADLIYAGALSNSGENLRLYNNSGNIIDEILCQEGWTGGDNKTKEPFKRIVTQEEKVAEVKPLNIYTGGIIISKIMPSPDGNDADNEYIEIKNLNNFEADLTNWIIRDKQGNVKEYVLKNKIAALSSLILTRPEAKITLNNSGDGLELLNPQKEIIDSVDFGKAQNGIAYIKTSSGWQWEGQKSAQAKPQQISSAVRQTASALPVENKENIEIDLSQKNKEAKSPVFLTGLLIAVFFSITYFTILKKINK